MSQPDTLTGQTIAGKYAIKERIGAGGMGAVYRAVHLQTGGEVAVKFLHGTAALEESAVKRFQLEARNAAQLRHANTIRVTDFGVDEGMFYLVMEYLVGRPLNSAIATDGPFSWRRAVHITRQVLASLWEAHEHARLIVHRDIKPANIFLVDLPGMKDHVKVLDFGIARSLAGTGAGTQGFIGTPYYMAPELWRGELVDARTDLYALGCVVFEMLSGAPPFVPPPSASEVLLPLLGMHCNEPPPRMIEAIEGVPVGIAAWVDRLLKKDRAERPPSAREALSELDRVAREADLAEHDGGVAAAPTKPRALGRPAPSLRRPTPRAAVPDTEIAELEPGSAVTPPTRSKSRGAKSLAPLQPASPPPAPTASSAPKATPARDAPAPAPATAAPTPAAPTSAKPVWIAVAVILLVVAVAVGLILGTDSPPPELTGSARGTMTFVPDQPRGALQFSYRARLSARDHVDDGGNTIGDAGQVLARDRANYHLNFARDAEDGYDSGIDDADAVAMFGQLAGQALSPEMKRVILERTPLVEVEVYDNGLGVEIISP